MSEVISKNFKSYSISSYIRTGQLIVNRKSKKKDYEIAVISGIDFTNVKKGQLESFSRLITKIHDTGFFDNSAHNAITIRKYSLIEEKIKHILKSNLPDLKKFILCVTLSTNNFYLSSNESIQELIEIFENSYWFINDERKCSWSRMKISQLIFPKIIRSNHEDGTYQTRSFALSKLNLEEYYTFLSLISFLRSENDNVKFDDFLKNSEMSKTIDYEIDFSMFSKVYNFYASKVDLSNFTKKDLNFLISYINLKKENFDPIVNKILIERYFKIKNDFSNFCNYSYVLTKEEFMKFFSNCPDSQFSKIEKILSENHMVKERNRFHSLFAINNSDEIMRFLEWGIRISFDESIENIVAELSIILRNDFLFEKICEAIDPSNNDILPEWRVKLIGIERDIQIN